MARAPASIEVPEANRFDDFPHPREHQDLIGHQSTVASVARALSSDRIPHAWILAGPEGIGKALLTYKITRFLLASPQERLDGLDIEPDSPTDRMIGQGSHPNLLVLRRPYDFKRKKLLTVIPVDEIRRINRFFGTTAAQDGWRIAIVDAAEDLNRQAANALLKTLEEPPERSIFFIVSHLPGRLLPTIRSRCRMVHLSALSDAEIGEGLERLAPETDQDTRNLAIASAGGSLRLALQLTTSSGKAVRDLKDVLSSLPNTDPTKLHALADQVAKPGAEAAFGLAFDVIRDWLAETMRRQSASATPRALARFAEVWEKVDALARDTDTYNLDRRQAFLLAFIQLQELLRPAR